MAQLRVQSNVYAGSCLHCRNKVEADKGLVADWGSGWRAFHISCWGLSEYNPKHPVVEQPIEQPTKEETTMSIAKPKLIERRVFINGQPAAGMTDNQIFEAIRAAEDEIRGLAQIGIKPKKLEAQLAKMVKRIEKVNAYVDNR